MLGSVGEAVFSAVFFLLGCVGLVLLFASLVVPEWRVNHEFVQATCKVLEANQLVEKPSEDGPLFGPEIKIEFDAGGDGPISTCSHYDIHGAFSSQRANAQAILDRFKENEHYPCWYDPEDPYTVVLAQGSRWWIWLAFTVPVSFIVLGAGGLIHTFLHWGKSAERRASLAQRAGQRERDFFAAGNNIDRRFPTVPEGADMTNSPGTKLKFRLPMATSPGWALFGILAFCIVWNGIVALFIATAIRSFVAGESDGKPWLLTLFIIPFAAIGVWAIVALLRQLLVTTGIGPTLVEISEHPLHPGGQYRAFLSQSGWLTVKSLRVSLICEEVATYRQGTDTRTETREVRNIELFRRDGFEIHGGAPFEADIELSVPDDAMHSFAADHNEIVWTLVVEGDASDWPNFRRAFSVMIRPAFVETAS